MKEIKKLVLAFVHVMVIPTDSVVTDNSMIIINILD